jgi:hypothetical protein
LVLVSRRATPATSRRRRRECKLSPLGEIVVDVTTLLVAAVAFAPEISEALSLTYTKEPSDERR